MLPWLVFRACANAAEGQWSSPRSSAVGWEGRHRRFLRALRRHTRSVCLSKPGAQPNAQEKRRTIPMRNWTRPFGDAAAEDPSATPNPEFLIATPIIRIPPNRLRISQLTFSNRESDEDSRPEGASRPSDLLFEISRSSARSRATGRESDAQKSPRGWVCALASNLQRLASRSPCNRPRDSAS